MTADAAPQVKNNAEHFKNSCSYSVEVAKQFLTFGAGGIAFLVAMILTPPSSLTTWHYVAFGAFALSVLLGFLYIMGVVGHIAQNENYNVYSPALRTFCALQMVFFFAGILVLGYLVVGKVRSAATAAPSAGSSIQITMGDKKVQYPIAASAAVHVTITTTNIDLQVQPPPKK
jgi:hypothetical protein